MAQWKTDLLLNRQSGILAKLFTDRQNGTEEN